MANICDVLRRFSSFLPSEPSELLGTPRYTSEHADNDMTLCSGLRNSIIKNPIFWTSQICGRIFSDVLRRPGTLTIYHIWVVFSSCLEIFYLPLIHFFASNHKELKNVAEINFFVNNEYLLTSQDVADIVQIFETHDKYLRRSKIKMFHWSYTTLVAFQCTPNQSMP